MSLDDVNPSLDRDLVERFLMLARKGYNAEQVFDILGRGDDVQYLVPLLNSLYSYEQMEKLLWVLVDPSPEEMTRSFDEMNGREFEEFLADTCRNIFLYDNVELTPASSDQGVDLVLATNGIRIAVQAKIRVGGRIGNDAVQQVHAGAKFYRCSRSIVITNSTFTHKAIELAGRCKVRLVGGEELNNLIAQSSFQPF